MSITVEALGALIEPEHTAVLTMELQRAIVGDLSPLPDLADAAERSGAIAGAAKVCKSARSVGARVVHCTMEHRPDGAGYVPNARILKAFDRMRTADGRRVLETGGPGAEVLPELAPAQTDLVVPRFCGVSPFMPSGLDQTLRNLGIRTVVATGVSVNIGVIGMVIEAVNLGYTVVLPRDAIAGVPDAYAASIIDTSLAMLAYVVTADDIEQAWKAHQAG